MAAANMAAVISRVLAQPWPRWRIHTTIPADMEQAISSAASSGYCAGYPTSASARTPRTAAPRTAIPTNIAAIISR
jgi:hypothetical protein